MYEYQQARKSVSAKLERKVCRQYNRGILKKKIVSNTGLSLYLVNRILKENDVPKR